MTCDEEPMGRSAHTPAGTPDDRDEWMDILTSLDDQQVDALFDGVAPVEGLAPVAEVVHRLRQSVALERIPPMSAALRAQLAEPPVISLHAHRAARGAVVKAAAAAAVAALAVLGAGAAQNRLPSGVQDVVSSTAELVGIDVPRSDERHDSEEGEPRSTNDGSVPTSQGAGNGGEPGHEGTTPGGATPADPGTPGDHQPATPATPPAGTGQGSGNGNGPAGNNASPTGRENGTGNAGSSGNGATNANPNGQANGTGNSKGG